MLQQEAHRTQSLRTEQQGQTELLGQVGESIILIVCNSILTCLS